jgi:hypothetical protein
MVTTWVQSFGDENTLYMTGSTKEPDRLLTDNFFHVASLFRRERWEDSGGYCETLPGYQDWDLWLSFMEKGYIWETVEEPLFRYRVRSGSMVTKSDAIRPQLLGMIVDRHRELFQRNLVSVVVHREKKIKSLKDELIKYRLSEERNKKIREALIRLEEPIAPGEELFLFGAGQMAQEYMGALNELKANIIGVFDNDKSKHGSKFGTMDIEEPRLQERRVVVASIWGGEIYNQLQEMGYECRKIINIKV